MNERGEDDRLHEATAQFRQRRASGGSQHPSNGTESVSAIAAPVTMGLKEFSRAVWYKVMEKRETDYHEMAEEMLRDMDADGAVGHGTSSTGSKVQNPLDERNVRRRVYDALNVMMAVGVIEKDTAARKILWKGFAPKARDQTDGLEKELKVRKQRLEAKRRALRDLVMQQLASRLLIQRNQLAAAHLSQVGQRGCDASDGEAVFVPSGRIRIPFVALITDPTACVLVLREAEVSTAVDAVPQPVTLRFDHPVRVLDYKRCLEYLGLHDIAEYDFEACVPTAVRKAAFSTH